MPAAGPPAAGASPGGSWRGTAVPGEAPTGRSRSVVAGPGLVARVLATDRRDGDLQVDGEPAALAARRRGLVDRPWVWLRQVHGDDVVVLDAATPVEAVAGQPADAVVTRRTDVVLAVHSADCATVALVGIVPPDRRRSAGALEAAPEAVIGAVHAGWRGLVAGVVPATVAAMRDVGATEVQAVLGPCIGVECYEFGDAELERVVAAVGPAASGRTRAGAPALDVRLGVRAALRAADVEVVAADQRCTACGPEERLTPGGRPELPLFSHRARRDTGRQALLVWLERTGAAS